MPEPRARYLLFLVLGDESGSPTCDAYEIAGRSTAAEEVGGDFFDHFTNTPDPLGFAIGDASGHGLPAALLARDVLVGLRMVRWNRLSAAFVSVIYAEREPGGHIVYGNAGQPPPLLVAPDSTTRLRTGDAVLGPIADLRFRRSIARIAEGSVLVLYTDGIPARLSACGARFGEAGIEQTVRAHLDAPADAIPEAVFREAEAFADGVPWEDHATAVVVMRPPGTGI